MNTGFIGFIGPSAETEKEKGYIGSIAQIKDIINIYKVDEVIFCAKDLPSQIIIDKMSELNVSQVEFKIAPPESLSIIGSQSIKTSGDIFILELDSITKSNNKRTKRFFDLTISVVLLPLSPLLVFFQKRPQGLFSNLFQVIIAKKSWVGYRFTDVDAQHKLPKIKSGVLNPTDVLKSKNISPETIERLNLLYARDYKVINDLNILIKGFSELGR